MTDSTFMVACKNHFGFKEGQSLTQFAAEIKELTPQDKLDLKEDFKAIDINITNV